MATKATRRKKFGPKLPKNLEQARAQLATVDQAADIAKFVLGDYDEKFAREQRRAVRFLQHVVLALAVLGFVWLIW